VFLSGQEWLAWHKSYRTALRDYCSMRAGPGLMAFPAWLACFCLQPGWLLLLGSQASFLGRLSINRIFCLNDALLLVLRKSPKYKVYTISNAIIVALALPIPSITNTRLLWADAGFSNDMQPEPGCLEWRVSRWRPGLPGPIGY